MGSTNFGYLPLKMSYLKKVATFIWKTSVKMKTDSSHNSVSLCTGYSTFVFDIFLSCAFHDYEEYIAPSSGEILCTICIYF